LIRALSLTTKLRFGPYNSHWLLADGRFSAVTGIPAWWRANPPRGGARQPPLTQDCPAAGLRQGIPRPPQPSEAQGSFYMYLNPAVKTLNG